MRAFFARLFWPLLVAACFLLPITAQSYWQSRNQIAIGGSPPAYVGPGDVASGAAFYWGLRCYNNAYTGNVADVFGPGDILHTLITCSTGGILNETISPLAATCAVSCTVQTLYNQSGSAITCPSTTTCEVTQNTEANRPAYVINCTGFTSKPCMVFTAASTQVLLNSTGVGGTVLSQPYSISVAAIRPTGTAQMGWFTTGGPQTDAFGFQNVANTMVTYCGNTGVLNNTATDNVWHAALNLANGASSNMFVDGSSATVGQCGAETITGILVVGRDFFGNYLNGRLPEVGIWNSDLSSSASTMSSNQKAWWGY